MTANVITHTSQPALRPVRIRRPRPRAVAGLLLLALVALVASAPGAVAHAAHATCTLGTPEHATCGDALVLLGYP